MDESPVDQPLMIVADAGPLIALAILDLLPVLKQLFPRVLVPAAVVFECTTVKPGAAGACQISAALQHGVLTEVPVEESAQAASLTRILDAGEAEAILLAEQQQGMLLIDERKGRKIALQRGVEIIGTGAILVAAKRHGLITEVKPRLSTLQQGGYRISTLLYDRLLKLAGE